MSSDCRGEAWALEDALSVQDEELGFVCTTAGRSPSPGVMRGWRRHPAAGTSACGIIGMGSALRHTHSTLLLEVGVAISVVSSPPVPPCMVSEIRKRDRRNAEDRTRLVKVGFTFTQRSPCPR